MDNGSQLSELVSNKRETTDLKVDQQISCLLHLRGSGVLKWGHRNKRGDLRKSNEVRRSKKALRVEASESHESNMASSLTGAKKKRGDNNHNTSGDSEKISSKKIAGRWSVHRCESAKTALLEVVKQMGATRENPVLRCDLRAKARRHIGDTGLLDHLLRHMAGEVFPDGKERLVRRHNSEGAIQYWLEPAELADVRREAGIGDMYWVPPPGWKPGDDVSDRTCGGGACNERIDSLKIEIAELKAAWSQVTELKETVRNQQEEICLLKKEIEKRTREDNNKLAVVVKETCIASRDNLVVQERVMAKQTVGTGAGSDKAAGLMKKTARGESAFRICRPEGTFLWPNMQINNNMLPSPTSPLPPRLPAFFCQQLPGNDRMQVHGSDLGQSVKGVLVPALGQGVIQRSLLPRDMMNSGANASNGVESGASSTSVMAPAVNSGKTDGSVMTDLTLGSYNNY